MIKGVLSLICIAALAAAGYVAFHHKSDNPNPIEPPVTPDDNQGFVEKMAVVQKTASGACPPYSHLNEETNQCEARVSCKRVEGPDFFMDPAGKCIADCSEINYNTD
jgi:hypothetical protein